MNDMNIEQVVYHPEYDAPVISGPEYLARIRQEYSHTVTSNLPLLIGGGMGVNISNWRMAQAIAKYSPNTLGTVSGVMLHGIMIDALQNNKPDAPDILRILNATDFPFPEIATKIIKKYHGDPRQGVPIMQINPPIELIELLMCSAYVYVKLAKEGHNNKINLNLLEKTAIFNMYTLYGAMLAGLDILSVGAGIPEEVRAVFMGFVDRKTVSYDIEVVNDRSNPHVIHFDPRNLFGSDGPDMRPPTFLSIISGYAAGSLGKKAGADAFILESHAAAGHNAKPRNKVSYGPKDEPNMQMIFSLGLPVIRAGGCSFLGSLRQALDEGFYGIQIGSLLSTGTPTGMDEEVRRQVLKSLYEGTNTVTQDPNASPTTFPFRILTSPELPDVDTKRGCTIRGLASLCRDSNGNLGFRCPAEPKQDFIRKGGLDEVTTGCRCLCRELCRTAGIQNKTNPLVTHGTTDIRPIIRQLMGGPDGTYTITQALNAILRDKAPTK